MSEQSDLPRRMLTIICKVLAHDKQIPAEMSEYGVTPCIETKLGRVVYFQNSGDYRIFLKERNQHKTFTNPTDLIQYLGEQSHGAQFSTTETKVQSNRCGGKLRS
jgi:hypothetical protein